MIKWIRNLGIIEVAFVVLLLVFGSCRKEGGTTTVEGFVYDTTNAQRIPLAGAEIKVGVFSMGGGVLSGGSQTYGTSYSDENGYYKIKIEAPGNEYDVYCSKYGWIRGQPYSDRVKAGRKNQLDFFLYRFDSQLKINFERIPPLTDTLVLIEYAWWSGPLPRYIFPDEPAAPIYTTISCNYQKLVWEVRNGTKQQFSERVYCADAGQTAEFTIQY